MLLFVMELVSAQSQQFLIWELFLFVLSAEDKIFEILIEGYHSLSLSRNDNLQREWWILLAAYVIHRYSTRSVSSFDAI